MCWIWLRNTYRSLKIECQPNLLKFFVLIYEYVFNFYYVLNVWFSEVCLGTFSVLWFRLPFQKYNATHFYISINTNGISQHTCVSLEMTVSTVQIDKRSWGMRLFLHVFQRYLPPPTPPSQWRKSLRWKTSVSSLKTHLVCIWNLGGG